MKLLLLMIAITFGSSAWADDEEKVYTERDREKCLRQLERREQPDDQCDEILGLDDSDDGNDDGSVYDQDDLSDNLESNRAERLDERAENAEERGHEERAERLEERSDNVEERRDDLKDGDLVDRDEGDEKAQPKAKAKSRAKAGRRGGAGR